MSLFDAFKTAADQAKGAASAIAGNAATDLLSKHSGTICEALTACAHKVAENGSVYISDEAKYKATIIDPAWDLLPLPLRVLGRERLQWDAMFLAARSVVFVIDGDSVCLHPDARQRFEQLMLSQMATNVTTLTIDEGARLADQSSTG